MCDICPDVLDLLQNYENDIKELKCNRLLQKHEINILCVYVQGWSQRQCTCCYKEPKNFDRFNDVIQGLLLTVLDFLRQLIAKLQPEKPKSNEDIKEKNDEKTGAADKPAALCVTPKKNPRINWDDWNIDEKEKLLHIMSKVFLLNFPLYVAFKHSVHSKLEEFTQEEIVMLSSFCDVNDLDIPIYLLRNACFFCKHDGLKLFRNCFHDADFCLLPLAVSHAMTAIVSNLKLWMSIGAVVQHLVPLRSSLIRYLCRVSDKDLRLAGNRNMFEYMWTAIKDPLDAHTTFDKEGLDLALKYFCSSTLTMRLAGVAQINSHINMYNELCHNETLVDTEGLGNALANWLTENKIVEYIFGPNLHVEIIKQSHIILNYLAMEGRITNEHIDAIWSACQLKHCSKQVLDLLPPLIKNLEVGPVRYLYRLLNTLEPKEHTEQTLLLASALIKFIWTNGGSAPCIGEPLTTAGPFSALMKRNHIDQRLACKEEASSSERSVSVEASNSEDEDEPSDAHHPQTNSEVDSSQVSDRPRSSGEGSEHAPASQASSGCSEEAFYKAHGASGRKRRRHRVERRSSLQKDSEPGTSSDETDFSTDSHLSCRNESLRRGRLKRPMACYERTIVDEASEESAEDKVEHVTRRKLLRRKRPRMMKKSVHQRQDAEVEEFSEDSMDKIRKRGRPHNESPQQPRITIKDMSDDRRTESEEEKRAESEDAKEQGHILPALVKVVLHRDAAGLCFEGECPHYLARLRAQRHVENSGPEEGSCNSSHVSNKSEKNMADFDGEESVCEDELSQLAAHPMTQRLANIACMYPLQGVKSFHHSRGKEEEYFDIEAICKSGQTLLWDLVQDDKIGQLGEGLALEAEKILCNLVCWATHKMIRMKFIEGCLDNLSSNRSVLVSLRILPKLLGSFQQFRESTDTHSVTMWAEKEHKMMKHFFTNLVAYTALHRENSSSSLYTHTEEIQVRLHFLFCVFSAAGSPDSFRLSKEQVDTLWSCLAMDKECGDELFSWLLNQAKSQDQHALNLDLFKHILLQKMPQLPPETTSMTALSLLQQLSSLARLATASYDTPSSEADVCGIQQLWGIALKALNTDVSMAAIQNLNNYYINVHHGTLEKEEDFIQQCMDSLLKASQDIHEAEESNLMIIQRALLLLTTHIETFHRRYAYHLRHWHLSKKGMARHMAGVTEKQGAPLRIICQPAGMSDKATLELHSTDYIADLRAEITYWWDTLRKRNKQQQEEAQLTGSTLVPILGNLLTDGPIRMISQGQELTCDLDERSLGEMGFKDLQLVFVSVGAARPGRRREGLEPASILPPPPRERLPAVLLLQAPYFEMLFSLMQQLGSLKAVNRAGDPVPHTKAQVLSRRVWEVLMILPTSPTMLQGLKDIPKDSSNEGSNYTVTLQTLLNPEIPQKLMYSLQIVEALHMQGRKDKSSASKNVEKNDEEDDNVSGEGTTWTQKFIEHGGLRHLFDIFMSGVLQSRDGEDWNEWNQDCLASLLKLLYQFGLRQGFADDMGLQESSEVPRKRTKRIRKGSADKLMVPKLNKTMLQMMSQVESVLKVLMTILYEAALPCDPNQYKTGFWGRAQVVHCTITLLVSWAFSEPLLKTCLFQYPGLDTWLKRLVLDDPEPAVRREACTGLYRLCLGTAFDGKTGHKFITPLLSSCLRFLSVAQSMKPPRPDEEEKEPYGPGCKDYFWLVCRLVDSLDEELLQKHDQEQKSLLNLDNLARYLAEAIVSRDYREVRHITSEDDGLRGLLTLATVVLKHNPPFKFSKEGREFLLSVFECLFALPNPRRRYLPKCKSHQVRAAAFDLLVELVKGCKENYHLLHSKLLQQHSPDSHAAYPWDYWPHEDGRSECGYVGLTNLGATCYLASCMQHLYMMPQARASILSARNISENKHENTLQELQRMFAYLMESERKAYNPRSFCKVYTMDHQPLNTGEQKDMAEFFTDLISKLEEMTPQLKSLVKNLFCGTISNNVVSLDCPHISRTIEEFYTLRCQVADMRNLYESLDELTVKDTLEGDNMYTCSQCGKKVRAEKRACIKKLPHILCFNTMRYTFNMVTMTKEKVNTHFSFPLRLDMAQYMEKNLMPDQHREVGKEEEECYEYDLIGVTVHTGTADGGHYYSFIRERQHPTKDKWFLFNDAEVKLFDPAHIAAECFGGEMTSKTYDSVTDKFLDFSFEKTNSAYMLFYERINPKDAILGLPGQAAGSAEPNPENIPPFELSQELAEWIWQDNMQFLQDRSVFEHTYFNFMWQICGYIPQTLTSCTDITLLSAKLGTSFVLETLIHAKEKPTIAQWIELLTKQFNASQSACEWFLDHMADNDWWPIQILLKCPNQVVRQLFQRLCIHVINQLKPVHSSMYLQPYPDSDDSSDVDLNQIGQYSCVTRFIKRLLMLVEHGAKQHLKHLTEYFAFLLEFAKMGDEECQFLLSVEAVTTIVNFYLGQKASEYVEVTSDDEDEDEDDVVSTADDKYKPASLERMITLVALLVEKSRGEDHRLHLSHSDFTVVASGKGFPFLYQQIKDNINLRQTCNLIFSLCRWNEHLALHLVNMFFTAITKQQEASGPFFKMLSLLVEFVGGPPGMPPFTNLILQRIWETAEYCPQQCLEWLTVQVPRNKLAHSWVLQNMDSWVERFLIAHSLQRVRYVAALLLVSLVPSNHFRQVFRSARSLLAPQKEIPMSSEALLVMHQIYDLLLNLFKRAKLYVDPTVHGTTKLMSYFAVITYCLISKAEKLMFSPHFLDLWNLFQPKLSEPAIPVHHNKQALLIFWYQVCVDCPENIKLIIQNTHVTKNIAFNYILADHDDQDVVVFNRCMLPAYYGLLRLCCQQSRPFTRQLASHQNIQWAFKNITPYTTQYTAAINELFKLMRLFVAKFPDSTEQELREIQHFKCTTLQLYLTVLDARSCWATLINALRILMETTEDRLFVIGNNGISLLFQAFQSLHLMYHEATACHVTGEMVELLATTLDLLKCARARQNSSDVHQWLSGWKERADTIHKLLTLLNSYTPPEVRHICIDVLQELVWLCPEDTLSLVVPILANCHASFQQNNSPVLLGPFFPHQGQKIFTSKSSLRPPRPMLQMFLHPSQLEVAKGLDEMYDHSLLEFFTPYHQFVDMLCRLAVSHDLVNMEVVNISVMLAIEGIPLHISVFPKLWLEIYHSEVGNEFLQLLYSSSYLVDYVEAVLLDERPSLNNPIIYQFFSILMPKVSGQVINDQTMTLVMSLVTSLGTMLNSEDLDQQAFKLNGDLRALALIFAVEKPPNLPEDFLKVIRGLNEPSQMAKNPGECTKESENRSKASETSEPSTSSLSETTSATKDKADPQTTGNQVGSCEALQWAEILRKSARALLVLLEPAL